jgi:hypothetical protein
MLPDVQVCKAEPLQQNEVDYALSAIAGDKPVIQVFKANPMVLDTATSTAVYTFKVKLATNVVINEAGTNIKNISNPSGATLSGTATGLPASAIPMDATGEFITSLIASNDNGSVQAELTLSLAKELLPEGPPAGQSGETGRQTGDNKSKWLDQLPISLPSKSIQSYINKNEPNFFKCPSGCEYCLKPEDAAGRGFNQRCSEEPCYYSPDNQQKWYCYKPTPGWCCQGGKVNPATRDECAQIQGFWSTNQNEAIQACQPVGFCCRDGQIYSATQSQCAQAGGTYYDNVVQAKERCQPVGFCCQNGQVYSTTRAQCAQTGGTYYANQAQAIESCRQAATCWCCSGGKVYQTTKAQCAQSGGTCYSTESQATAGCRQTTPTTPKTPYLR